MIKYNIQYRQFVDVDDDEVNEGWLAFVAEDSDDAIAQADNILEKLGFEYELLACEGGKILN